MADRHKRSVGWLDRNRASHRVFERHPGQPGRAADKMIDRLVPQHLDMRIGKQPVFEDFLAAQRIAAVNQRHVLRMVGHVECFFDRSVAAADHHHFLAAVEEPVAGRAGRNALARQLQLARHAEPLGLRAGGNHQRFALIDVAAIADGAERPAIQIDRNDRIPQHPRANVLGLGLHFRHQPRPLNHIAEAGVVLDVGGDGQLAAGLQALHHDWLQPRARAIDCGREPRRAGADDQHAGGMCRHEILPVRGTR